MSRRRAGRSIALATPAYTLLELLIVMTLIGVLMLGIWSMLSNWGDLYERGEQRTRKAQLARSLSDQLTDDLHDVTYRPPARRHRRQSKTPAPSGIGLVGEAEWMVLDVLQPVNPYHAARMAKQQDSLTESDQPAIWVPEVQRVIYRFYGRSESSDEPLAAAQEQEVAFFGLVRLGIAREYYSQLTAHEEGSASLDRGANTLVGEVDRICQAVVSEQESDPLVGDQVPGDGQQEEVADMGRPQWLPGIIQQDELAEVGWLEFRYYNGSGWQSRWDSRTEGRLPVAVEVRYELIEPPAEDQPALSEEEQAEAELLEPAEADDSSQTALLEGDQPQWAGQDETLDLTGEAADEPPPYYRCIVYLEPPKKWPAATEEPPEGEGFDDSELNPLGAPGQQSPSMDQPTP
jgi:type II secretory pathway pseudopilin PulG